MRTILNRNSKIWKRVWLAYKMPTHGLKIWETKYKMCLNLHQCVVLLNILQVKAFNAYSRSQLLVIKNNLKMCLRIGIFLNRIIKFWYSTVCLDNKCACVWEEIRETGLWLQYNVVPMFAVIFIKRLVYFTTLALKVVQIHSTSTQTIQQYTNSPFATDEVWSHSVRILPYSDVP